MVTIINSLSLDSHARYTKALPTAPTRDSEQKLLSKPLPSLPASNSPLPEKKYSKAMSIPHRAVGSTSIESKKTSIASISSSGYSDSILSRGSPRYSNFTKDSLSYAGSEFRKTPPLPEEDEQRQTSPKTPNKNSANPRSISNLKSSPGQEIWRRRSLLTQKGIEFPDLNLKKSNGSTASPPSQNINPAPDRSLPELPSQLLRSRGLLDREKGPIPAREVPQAPAVPPMGAKISKLKDISKRKATDQTDDFIGHSDRITDQPRHVRDVNTSNSSNSSHGRLPTPEYLRSDKSQLSTPQVFSPTKPHDLSTAPQVSIKSDDSHIHGISVLRLGGPSTLQQLTLVPNLLSKKHTRNPSETLTITSLPSVVRSPQPQKLHATKTILAPEPSLPVKSAPFSPSIASTAPTITTNPHSRRTSRTTTSRATSLSYSYFPLSPSSLPAPGIVLPAPPITSQHMDCFQRHKYMRRSRNDICPLQCQTCSKADFEQQWKCTWCCLRICGDCMTVFATVRKDLRTFLALIGRGVTNSSDNKIIVLGDDVGERSGNVKQHNETRQLGVKE